MAESIVKKTEQRCVVSSDFGQGFLLSFRIGINVRDNTSLCLCGKKRKTTIIRTNTI